ncbi:conjugative transfer ATPase [Cysteiniphilum halobium]|uniref:conjugative transfer ATPase n=1 Tax=Cysteiniphilum halobium TaxID=2219059 RepID=UPI000E653996|nr:conjugative transfer ATPase [Cysteiniphilum halobium]
MFEKLKKFSDMEKRYATLPSFLDEMALVDFNDELRLGVLDDSKTLVKFIDVKPFAKELKGRNELANSYKAIVGALASIPREEKHYWHMQVYFYKEMNLEPLKQRIHDYIDPDLLETQLTKSYLEMMNEHIDLVCQDGGLFKDKHSGAIFRGHQIRCRIALYRKYPQHAIANYDRTEAIEITQGVAHAFMSSLRDTGCIVTDLNEERLYEWLAKIFNPKPFLTQGDNYKLVKENPLRPEIDAIDTPDIEYGDEMRNFRFNLMSRVFFNAPETDDKNLILDGVKHRCLFLSELKGEPRYGMMTGDSIWMGGKYGSLFDRLPEGCIYTLQIAFADDDQIIKHLSVIEKRAMGKGSEPQNVRARVAHAYDAIKHDGNPLLWCTQAIIYNDLSMPIETAKAQITQVLRACHSIVNTYDDAFRTFPVDDVIRLLPCNWDHHYQKTQMYIANLHFASEIAALMPIYGRSTGVLSDNKKGIEPRFNFFTGSGESFSFDYLSEKYKQANFHLALFGSSGAGKSVMLNYMILCMMATMKCRVVVFEQGGSFDLMTLYMKSQGKKVQYLKFDQEHEVPFNPYADAYLMLEQLEREQARLKAQAEDALSGKSFGEDDVELIKKINAEAMQKLYDQLDNIDQIKADKSKDHERDLVTELVTITKMFIQGGDTQERITGHDTGLIMTVLEKTVRDCKAQGVLQVMPSHVSQGFLSESKAVQDKEDRKRLEAFHYAMESVITGKLSGYFNKPTYINSDFDYYHIDLGFLANHGNEANLNIVSISVLSRVLSLCQATANDGIPTIFIIDEAHILFKYKLLADFLILMSKISRKINLNILPATQNLSDMSETGGMQKMLSMMDTIIGLYMDKKEREMFQQNKQLPDEVMAMLDRARKCKPFYSEAVLMHENWQGIFKNIPPRLPLALAMTDPNEKALRKSLSEEFGYTTLEAVGKIANDLKAIKAQVENYDAMFD